MPNERLQYLFNKFIKGTCTPPEKKELATMALAFQHEEEVRVMLEIFWNEVTDEIKVPDDKAASLAAKILQQNPAGHSIGTGKLKSIKWRRMIAAAAVLLVIGLGSYFLFLNKPGRQTEVNIAATDVQAPKTTRAMITLADGSTVSIDSIASGMLALQSNVTVMKTADGKIVYRELSNETHEPVYNTLTNPRGSKVIDMVLEDGSHVWLNAGSSVTYPVAFAGDERSVTITGEAYFEVQHDKTKPFYVSKGDVRVQVLGTRFNVNAYEDEAGIKVTLLEGAVKVVTNSGTLTIKPGEQAQISAFKIQKINTTEPEAVIAWKNGYFNFINSDIKALMRELARWYDVEVIDNTVTSVQRFGGEMPRNSSLSQVMEILKTSGVKFTIEGRTVTVNP